MDVATEILQTLKAQADKFTSIETDLSSIRTDLGDIKTDIGQVRKKCDEIGQRCDCLEENIRKLTSSLTETKNDVDVLFGVCSKTEDTVEKLSARLEEMNSEIESLKENCDRLENFSRRDNLRMYGLPQTEKFESFDTCTGLVVDTLNSVEGPKRWTTDDIVRAHRVGGSRDDRPKPMIIKFSRWKDKMAVITDHGYRDRLKEKGVTVANDLTKKQASLVAEARREGKVAFFKRGKLIVEPRRPNPKTFAEVAAAANDRAEARASVSTPSSDSTPREASASATEGRGQREECGRVDGTSPLHVSQRSDSDSVQGQCTDSSRGARAQRGGRGGAGRGDHNSAGIHRFFPPRRSSPPVNKSQANDARPRRSSRSTTTAR